jgi:hypothetical protein
MKLIALDFVDGGLILMIFKFLLELGIVVLKDVQVLFHRDLLMEISELEEPEAEGVNSPDLAFDFVVSVP